jgi:hypothetical protein
MKLGKGIILSLLGISVLFEAIGAWGYSWSTWDIGTRDVWSWQTWEIADCAQALVEHVGGNFKLFIWPSLLAPIGTLQIFPPPSTAEAIISILAIFAIWVMLLGGCVILIVEWLEKKG